MAITTVSQHVVSVNAIQGTLIADNAITAVHIATNAVSGTLIADNAVTATHIAQNTITVTQLADDAVEADKIADGVITTNHLNKAMISSQTEVTAVAGDFLLIGDTSDSNNLKKIPISGITNLVTSFNADQAQVFNESGNDVDFRIESNDSANMFSLDAGNNKILIEANNTASVTDSASMIAASAFEINGNASEGSDILRFFAMADGTGNYGMEVSNSGGNAHYDLMLNPINGGKVVIGDTVSSGVDDLLQIETPASGGGHGIQIRRNDSNNDQGIGRIMFGNNTDTDLATIQATTDGSTDNARLAFFTQPNGGSSTERMRIHASGCVGVGSTADRSLGTNIGTFVVNGSAGGGLWLSTGDSSATTSKIYSINNGSVGELIINSGSGVGAGGIKFTMNADATPTAAQTKMNIASNGRVYIGNIGGGVGALNIMGEVGQSYDAVQFFHNSSTAVGYIRTASSSTSYSTSSDYRLKENVDYTWDATTRLKQLKPARFNWIADDTNTLLDGFLAHEVSSIVPEAITGEKDATETYTDSEGKTQTRPQYQGIDHSKLVPLLVKTIQELEARIATLES